jgi:hypothetical protein
MGLPEIYQERKAKFKFLTNGGELVRTKQV